MPVHQNPDGSYQWGQSGKKYPTKKQAEAQGAAAHANGYQDQLKVETMPMVPNMDPMCPGGKK